MKTAEEIALKFSERFQKNYPSKPLWQMMDDLRKEIEAYADQFRPVVPTDITQDSFWFDLFNKRHPDEVAKILDDQMTKNNKG